MSLLNINKGFYVLFNLVSLIAAKYYEPLHFQED